MTTGTRVHGLLGLTVSVLLIAGVVVGCSGGSDSSGSSGSTGSNCGLLLLK
jgi:hypothetical protein